MTVRVERIPGVRIVWEPGLSSQRRRGLDTHRRRSEKRLQQSHRLAGYKGLGLPGRLVSCSSMYQVMPAEMMVNAQADARRGTRVLT